MCNEQMYKELGRKRVWEGGLELWEEQSPIDKKLAATFQKWQGRANQFRKYYVRHTQSPLPFVTVYFLIQRLMLIIYFMD